MSSNSRIIYTAAGEAPEVKLKDLVAGRSYRLMNPVVATRDVGTEDIQKHYNNMYNNLYARPHILESIRKQRGPVRHPTMGLIPSIYHLIFKIVPADGVPENTLNIVTENGKYNFYTETIPFTNSMGPHTLFVEHQIGGGKRRKSRRQKYRKSTTRRMYK